MPDQPKYALSFSLNVLHHLGIGLYSNIPAVLSEMVANSWDAGAEQVMIILQDDTIIIVDDGQGMSNEDINQQYLRVGYQKRRKGAIITVGKTERHVMGRKGIGKLSVFSIANTVRVETVKDGSKNGFLMSLPAIEEGAMVEALQYNPEELKQEDISIDKGTKITLTNIKQPLADIEIQLRTELARRFSILDNTRQFEVIINETPISLKDRNYFDKIQYIWYLGDDSKKYVEYCTQHKKAIRTDDTLVKGYKVSGWIGTVFKPKDISDQHHVISIFAHGKLIQEDILADIQEARIFKTYIIGEIDADFMDTDDDQDIVTSDRQRINQNDPRYALLKEFVAKQIRKIGNSWDNYRNEEKNKRNSTETELHDIYSPLPANQDQSSNQIPEGANDSNAPDVQVEVPQEEPPLAENSSNDSSGSNQANATTNGSPTNSTPPITGGSSGSSGSTRLPQPPRRDAQSFFNNIRIAISASILEQSFKDVLLYDLDQSRLAFNTTAYKACVITLGSIVEGLMLATLRRSLVMEHILNDPTPPNGTFKRIGGLRNPDYTDRAEFARALGRLSYDEYRQIIYHYLPHMEDLGIGDVQRFRNAVHPWVAVQRPEVYGNYTHARAVNHLAALELLMDAILAWNP